MDGEVERSVGLEEKEGGGGYRRVLIRGEECLPL